MKTATEKELTVFGRLLSRCTGLSRRNGLALVVVGAHVVLAVLFMRSTVVMQATPLPPLTVTLLDEAPRPVATPKMPEPVLVHAQPISMPLPLINLPSDPESTAISVAAAPVAHSEASPPSAAPAREAEPATMSEVAYLREPDPRYPPQSRHAREEGLVVLKVMIDMTGRVVSVDIERSSGHARLDQAARDAVARALFRPYRDDSGARAAFARIPIEFSLHAS